MYLNKKNKETQITVIIPLYKTPLKNVKIFYQYKNYKLVVLDQCPDKEVSNKIKELNLEYHSIKKNIGLSKATSFLLSKVKTRYCLFTQADILINHKSIKIEMIKKNNVIFSGPRFVKKFFLKNIKQNKNNTKIVKNLNAACMLCDIKKIKKIGFFDEDFFLYW